MTTQQDFGMDPRPARQGGDSSPPTVPEPTPALDRHEPQILTQVVGINIRAQKEAGTIKLTLDEGRDSPRGQVTVYPDGQVSISIPNNPDASHTIKVEVVDGTTFEPAIRVGLSFQFEEKGLMAAAKRVLADTLESFFGTSGPESYDDGCLVKIGDAGRLQVQRTSTMLQEDSFQLQ